MNLDCSACGAPLHTRAKFCPACALPPTAVAMPTPAARKRQVSIPAIVLCCIGIVWVVAYASYRYESAKAKRIADGFNAMQAAAVADDASPGGINHHLEEKIEQDLWSKPRELRGWRQTMAERLERHQQCPRDDQAAAYDDSLVRGDVAFYQAAVARIDSRLKQLGPTD